MFVTSPLDWTISKTLVGFNLNENPNISPSPFCGMQELSSPTYTSVLKVVKDTI